MEHNSNFGHPMVERREYRTVSYLEYQTVSYLEYQTVFCWVPKMAEMKMMEPNLVYLSVW